ncbi:DUF4422 domain-containing protein [Levilactobacillus koreensis]|uniref:DUF4422 domain-containing protein n=2 Tax=Levilactobacillus koreensis TaxID=637971 RepID=A0AAC8UY11_9LACO|nr:DUF4422 domain-containing protein [Levilactobacillus koreensis]AKP66068.1 hypothetical protein ABN16_10210 [Levilactobacillus koreensis]
MPEDKGLYLPVLVGAVRNYRASIEYQRDDFGDNISNKNPNYNELTAMYWAWKNLSGVEAIGLVHYRRYFFDGYMKNGLKNVLSMDEVDRLLQKKSLVVPYKRHYYIETNYSHYVHAHHSLPLIELRKIIAQRNPAYLSSFDRVMSRRSAHMFNMFIMRKKLFDAYCGWLFGLLQTLENTIDISNYSVQEKRVFGYLAELLLDVWIDQNNISYEEVPWNQLGPKHLGSKAYHFMLRKFGKDEKTHFE